MKLLHATKNELKYNLMKERLKKFTNIELVNPKMLGINIEVEEDGLTAEENSIKKAKAYYDATKLPTIAEDAGLYIDKFKEEEQPGLFVKRVNGKDNLTDDEIVNYYIDKLKGYNGRSFAHYFTGVAIVDKDGNIHSDTIDETEFLLTAKQCKKVSVKGGILESISFDLDAEKYFDERTKEEEEFHYKDLNEKYCNLVEEYVLKN
ncbi:MAG: hypothetical protein J6O56_01600 [Bacilli bacterium]|nr:hypothetical protein [Bacilli bacterium]